MSMRFKTKLCVGIASVLAACACESSPDVLSGGNSPTGSGEAGEAGATNDGNNGQGAGPSLGLDAGSNGGNAPGDMETCAANAQRVALVPLDMGLGVDTSYSMDFDDKWPQVRDALNVFARNPNYQNLGVALQFFPVRQQCNVDQYGDPVVPMQVLPGVQPAFTAAIESQRMFGGTPLVQLMQGMVG